MKRILCGFLAILMTMALIPVAGAETEKVYTFDMYGDNFGFTTSAAQEGDNALLKDSKQGAGYITSNDGIYVSASETKVLSGTNFWSAGLSFPQEAKINGTTVKKGTTIPRFAVLGKTEVATAASKSRYITFKFKVGTPGVAKNYAITTQTLKSEHSTTFAVYANGTYLGNLNNYVIKDNREINTTTFGAVRLVPDEKGEISLSFYFINEGNNYDTTQNTSLMPCGVSFTETAIEALDTVSLYATVLNGEGGSISSSSSEIKIGEVNEVSAGKSITLTAKADDGYKFAYWTDSEGRVLSDESIYTFSANCNGVIWAVFDKIGDTEKTGVDFFDGNRDSLGFVAAEPGKTFGEIEAPTPGLTGYDFTGWSVSDNTVINGLVRAVAQYAEEGKTLSGAEITVNGVAQGEKKYGEAIVCSDDNAAVWYLNGKPVAYGKSYTHYAWGNVEITSDNIEVSDKAPLVTLNEANGAYMMEYDAGDYTLLEAGILFGNEEHKSLSRCYSKAKVRNVSDHGSFTAKAKANGSEGMQTVARGYAVYKNGDTISVVYSD
ncbi:MAG: hypothetical protein E7473_01575 [Ruminococcaceae bacterium]|nr:hypothetical protein [Oscillospiraceae bacterium]